MVENEYKYIPKEYTCNTCDDVETMRDLRCHDDIPTSQSQDHANEYTYNQVKASWVGNYIQEILTETAHIQLKAHESFFQVDDANGNEFFDGPAYFHILADVVDPDNAHMIEKVRNQLSALNIKDYGYHIIKKL